MRRLKISFLNMQSLLRLDLRLKRLLRSCCRAALEEGGYNESSEISITFVGNEKIREINRDFRGIDSCTDVLSFPMAGNREFELNKDTGCYSLGDIIISTERALEQAKELGHSLKREVSFLVIHSTLHLIGYDHPDEDGEMTSAMRACERRVVSRLGLDEGKA